MVQKDITSYIVGVLFMCVCLGVSASTIMPTTSGTTVVSADSGSVDIISLSPPNVFGISFNEFSAFDINSRSLKLANVPSYSGSGGDEQFSGPASLIVIKADNIDIQNKITLLGPAADIIFITNNQYGDITCINCTFNNFLRVTLAAAQGGVLDGNSSEIGNVSAGMSSVVSLNGAYAPGAIGFDVLANAIDLTGPIDTHQRAIRDTRGGYINVAHGNIKVGSGQVSLMLGDVTWDYDTHQISAVGAYAGSRSLGGSVASSSVKITSSTDLDLYTYIDTRSDLISSVTYKNGTYIPVEGIEVLGFVDASISVDAELKSEGTITLSAIDNLSLEKNAVIEAREVQLIAQGRLINNALVHGDVISLAGKRVVNQGNLSSNNELHIWAEQEVANQYGGYISGDHVVLVSETRAVRNGSRTPYISRDIETNDLLSVLQYSYVADLNATKLGTYYSLNYSPANASGVSMANNNTAHISARNLEIKAVAFENINPFYKRVTDDTYLELSREKVDQVRISVEDNLSIKASSYVLNSSAQIIQNSPVGLVAIDTALFTNERYRVETIMGYSHESETTSENVDTSSEIIETVVTTTTVNELIGTHTVAYSPPGTIVAMGDFENKSTQSFLNSTAYIEIFGDGTFDTPYIKDFGFENQAIAKSETSTNTTTVIDLSSLNIGSGGDYVTETHYKNSETQAVDPSELDSLFYVHGNFTSNADFLENDGNALFANYNPLDYFIQQAMDDLLQIQKYQDIISQDTTSSISGEAEGTIFDFTTHIYNGNVNLNETDIDTIKAAGNISVSWSQTREVDAVVGGTASHSEESLGGTDNYSLLDELKKLFDRLANYFSEFFNEIVWWE